MADIKIISPTERYKAIADAIREKSGTTELMQPADMPQAILNISSGGAELDALEDLIDNSGVLEDTEGSVSEKVEQLIDKAEDEKLWLEITESKTFAENFFNSAVAKKLPKTNFINALSFYQFCVHANIEEIDYYINSCKCTNFNNAFYNCKATRIKGINLESARTTNCMFRSASIVTIEEPLNVPNVVDFGTPFWQCSTIENLRFVEETIHCSIPFAHSPKLSAESIQSIIDGLAYVETAQNLTLHTNVVAKLTVEQLTQITDKNWNVL